jgi:hypothetical protein
MSKPPIGIRENQIYEDEGKGWNTMEQRGETKLEKFTFANALDMAGAWIFKYTRLGCLFLIGIFLVVMQLTGLLGPEDTSWTDILWIFPVVVGTILIVTLVFYVKYRFKVVIESEIEAKEYGERLVTGRRWHGSSVKGVILEMRWIKKK